jgi:hypothetical protein
MTHKELLTKMYSKSLNDFLPVMSALSAVVELHTHVLTSKNMRGKSGLRKRCTECGFAYPCPTIQVIESTLV